MQNDAVSRLAVLDLLRTNWADNDGDTAMQISIDDVKEMPPFHPESRGMINEEFVNELIRHRNEVQNDFGWNKTLINALDDAIEALKLIPDGATNGDVVNIMFPKLSKTGVVVLDDLDNLIARVNIHWWNAPYKRGDGEC